MNTDDVNVSPAVLVVDDHPLNRLAAEVVLEPLGYAVVTASSGEEALRRVLERDFTLILLDVHMPDLDGYETASLLRGHSKSRDIPIVFLTAVYHDAEHTHRGYELGAVDYITKPFDAVVLRAKVRALVSLFVRGQRAEHARSVEVDRIKDLFLGAIGHDLRNPLAAVMMGAQVVAARPCSEAPHANASHRIARAADRMNRIIEDILDLTRGQFIGGVPVTPRAMDLVEVCEAVLAEFRVGHPDRAIDFDAPAGLRGHWDPDRLGRVVSNLVGNAIQHAVGEPIRVKVADAGAFALVEVHNGGEAIPSDLQQRLFEPFRRSDTSSQGLGLGLYIVREIARAHGGSVTVESAHGAGTLFAVRLPHARRLGDEHLGADAPHGKASG